MYLREVSQTKPALGGNTTLAFVTNMDDYESKILFSKLWDRLFRFERRFSRFLPLSELSSFNRSAGLKTPVSPDFLEMLRIAKQLSITTSGLFNPFIMPALQRAGYVKSAMTGHEDDQQTNYSDRVVVGIEELEIGDNWARIPFRTALDFGGFGKGYIANQLASILDSSNIQGYWLSLSGDIITKGHDEDGNKIYIDIQDANSLGKTGNWVIECFDEHCGIATSGTFRRAGQNTKDPWHHIIDPSTMKPAKTDIRLATICTNNTLMADVMASCAVILGSEKAPAFLKSHGVESALLQCIDKNGVTFEKSFGNKIRQKVLNA
jgi:thiamine biosynthesis lipoprotein